MTTAGVFATHAAASAEAWRLLSTGDARRIETWRRHGGRADLGSVLGEGRRPMPDSADDRLRPRLWRRRRRGGPGGGAGATGDEVDASDALRLADPPRQLPPTLWVALDGRPYPFRAGPPARPPHPIALLWRGTTGRSQAILDIVQAVAAGALARAAAEARIAAELQAWAVGWARVQTRRRRVS